jgi:hypothetical protein
VIVSGVCEEGGHVVPVAMNVRSRCAVKMWRSARTATIGCRGCGGGGVLARLDGGEEAVDVGGPEGQRVPAVVPDGAGGAWR